jgi:DNA repair protein RadC
MSKYKNLTDKELITLYINKIEPEKSKTEINNTISNIFEHDKNILDLLTNGARDKFLSDHVKEVWNINRAIYYRANQESLTHLKHFENINDIDSYLNQHFHGLPHEEVLIIGIDNNNNIIDQYVVNIGNEISTIINIKEIIRWSIETNSSGVILVHNHPNGKIVPSKADIITSNQLSKALQLVDISLIDSIIINDQSKFSLAKEKLID